MIKAQDSDSKLKIIEVLTEDLPVINYKCPEADGDADFDEYTTSYSDLANKVKMKGITKRNVGKYLGAIMRDCAQNDLPPLPALVAYKGKRFPGRGFYDAFYCEYVQNPPKNTTEYSLSNEEIRLIKEIIKNDWSGLDRREKDMLKDLYQRLLGRVLSCEKDWDVLSRNKDCEGREDC